VATPVKEWKYEVRTLNPTGLKKVVTSPRMLLLEVQLVQLVFHKGQVCTCEQVEV